MGAGESEFQVACTVLYQIRRKTGSRVIGRYLRNLAIEILEAQERDQLDPEFQDQVSGTQAASRVPPWQMGMLPDS